MEQKVKAMTADEEMFRHAMDSISDLGITIYDEEGRIIYFNEPSSRHDEIKIEDAIGKKPDEIYIHQTESTASGVLSSGKAVIDNTIIYTNKNGTINHCIGSSYPIRHDHKLLGAVSVIRFNDSSMSLVGRLQELQKQLSNSTTSKMNGTTYTLDQINGDSPAIREAVSLAENAARSNTNILIYGETGTGKELFAQGIHNASLRKDEPFVAINCSAIPETLLESMFFGTTKGAFTGAQDAPGIFENAKGGTVLLDEINSMPLNLQSKLLRVLQERVITRLGSSKLIPIECSIISTTNIDPIECIQNNLLREDLYYRLSVITINVPPLRDRKSDIIKLAQTFVERSSKIYGRRTLKLDESLKEALLAHSWPGNVRELQHVMEGMVVLTGYDEVALTSYHLPMHLRSNNANHHTDSGANILSNEAVETGMDTSNLHEALNNIERTAIINALKNNHGNLSRTAKAIGYSRSNLQYRIRKLGINP